MCEFCWWTIAEGLVVGVGAGFVLVAFAEWRKWRSRCEQIAEVEAYIFDEFAAFQIQGDLPRFHAFEAIISMIEAHETGALTPSQKTGLRKALRNAKDTCLLSRREGARLPSENTYAAHYGSFARIDWLDLPTVEPWKMAGADCDEWRNRPRWRRRKPYSR